MLPKPAWEQFRFQMERSPFLRYGIATLAVLLAILVRVVIHASTDDTLAIYQTFYLATIFIAWQVGLRPAIWTIVLGSIATLTVVYLWNGTAVIFTIAYGVEFLFYILISSLILWITEEQKKARLRAEYRRGAIENTADRLALLKREYEQTIRQLDRESAYLEAVLQQMPSGVIIASPAGVTLSMNRRAEELLGVNRPSLQETQQNNPYNVFTLKNGNELPLADYPLSQALRGETVRNTEVRSVVNGVSSLLRLSASPIYNAKSELIAGVLVIDDMAKEQELRDDLKKAGELADNERRRLQVILDVLPIGVTVADADGELIYMNEEVSQVWGENPPRVENTEGYAQYKAWHTDTGQMLGSEDWAMARALKNGDITNGEVLDIERFDGKHATMINSAAPIRDAEGKIIGGVATNTDITEVQQSQRALQESEARYRSLWNAGFEPRIIHQNGVILDINDAYTKNLGYTREDIIGTDGSFVFDNSEDIKKSREAAKNRSEDPYEVLIKRKDGTTFQAYLRSSNIQHPDGLIRLTTVRDISHLKQAEEQRMAIVETETRRRALRHFVNEFSHDFKTPMSVINTSSYLLDRMLTADVDRTRLHTIQEQVSRLSRMVDNLITLIKLDQQGEFELAPLDLIELLHIATTSKREQADKKGLTFRVSLPDVPIKVMGELSHFSQALVELLENAIRFTEPKGEISLNAYLEQGMAIVEIQDTGMGVTSSDLKRIFQPMYRADESRNVDMGGLGLGLSIVQQVIAMHRGSIDVSSEMGRGTIFRITLPILN